MSVAFEKLMETVTRLHRAGYTYRTIADLYPGTTHGDVSRVLHGHEPKKPEKRKAFGLPALGVAPICPSCRVVHVGKCPGTKKERPLFDQSRAELAWRFANREVVQKGEANP